MGINIREVKECIERNRLNQSLIGINLSKEKTIFCREGVGEYTSWHMDGSFVAQFGVETSSLRPQGKNPYDDLYSAAKGTSTALSTLTINPLGASARLRLSIDGVKTDPSTKNMYSETTFEPLLNTLLVEALLPENLSREEEKRFKMSRKMGKEISNNLSIVSMLYIYTLELFQWAMGHKLQK